MTYNDMPGMMKLTSASNPRDLGPWLQGVVLECLALPWESLFGPKLKIYVEITHSEHFVFYEKNLVVVNFLYFVYLNLSNFGKVLFLHKSWIHTNKSWLKFNLVFSFGQLLFICVHDLSKNRYLLNWLKIDKIYETKSKKLQTTNFLHKRQNA